MTVRCVHACYLHHKSSNSSSNNDSKDQNCNNDIRQQQSLKIMMGDIVMALLACQQQKKSINYQKSQQVLLLRQLLILFCLKLSHFLFLLYSFLFLQLSVFDNGQSHEHTSLLISPEECSKQQDLAETVCGRMERGSCMLFNALGGRVESCREIVNGDKVFMVPVGKLFMWPTFEVERQIDKLSC